MFEKFDPRDGKMLQILDEFGILNDSIDELPIMNDQDALTSYKYMLKTRIADEWAVSLNRQGRLPTIAPNKGQEANSVGALMALNKDDWFVQAFRELGGVLVRNIPLRNWYLTWLGNEIGNHYNIEEFHTLPVSVPIASQCLHSVGLAYAEKYKKSKKVSISFVGDGGTSEGDFYEAMNFAGIWKAPTIFYIQNNQWAISVPRSSQSATHTLAEKAFSNGFEGVQVDGNDVLAVWTATKMAAEKARNGGGPTLIEGYTYRLGAHTTADDPTRYRNDEEVKKWELKDPLIRIEKYLKNKNIIDDDQINQLKDEYKKYAMAEFEMAENFEHPTFEDTFKYTYKDMPPILEDQLKEFKKRKEL